MEQEICPLRSAGGSEMLPQQRGRAIHGHGLFGIPTFPRERGHPPNPECSRSASRLPPELWGRSGWLFTCSPGARPHTHVRTRAPALAHAPDAAFDFPLSAASPRRLHSSSPAAPRLQVPLSPTSGCQQYQYSQITPALLQQRAPGAAERAAQPHSGRWHCPSVPSGLGKLGWRQRGQNPPGQRVVPPGRAAPTQACAGTWERLKAPNFLEQRHFSSSSHHPARAPLSAEP